MTNFAQQQKAKEIKADSLLAGENEDVPLNPCENRR